MNRPTRRRNPRGMNDVRVFSQNCTSCGQVPADVINGDFVILRAAETEGFMADEHCADATERVPPSGNYADALEGHGPSWPTLLTCRTEDAWHCADATERVPPCGRELRKRPGGPRSLVAGHGTAGMILSPTRRRGQRRRATCLRAETHMQALAAQAGVGTATGVSVTHSAQRPLSLPL